MRRQISDRWLSVTLASMFGSVMLAGHARAATINSWNLNSTPGSWNTGSNWSTTNVPGSTEDAQIGSIVPAGTTVITLDADQTVYGLLSNPGSGKTLQINSGSPSTSKLILMSTDTSTDNTSTFFAASATSGTTQIGAPVQIGNATSGTTTAVFNSGVNASSFIFNADITDSPGSVGAVRISGNGTGIVNYGTTGKTYSGTTTISNAGILKLNTDNMIPDGAGKGNVVLEGNGQLQINNTNETINGLDSTSSTASVSKSGSNTRTLQIGNGDANGSYAGGITFTGGSSAITKIGLGTQKFGGTVSIPGAYTNSAGTSIINGAFSAASASTASSATIGGTGAITLTGAFTVNGKVAPGVTGPGVLSVCSASAALNASGSYVGEIGGNTPGNTSSNYDQLNFTSTTAGPTLGASLSLSIVNGYTPSASDVYYILTRGDGGAFGASTFASLPEGSSVSLGGGITGTITYLANWTGTQAGSSTSGGNDVAIYNITGVATTPEPASLSLLALVGVAGMRRRRIR